VGGWTVLSLGKLAPGQQQYYLDTVAGGIEEYYTGAKEAPGQWIGSAASRLGLAGEVDAVELGRVLEHVDPKTGTYRLTGSRSVPVVAGFDATFNAPKSVSLLFALGDPEVSNEVRNAHEASQAAALRVLERAACRVRRGRGGHTVLDGGGFVAAAFRHRTSRAGDPHLHTHVLIANLAHAPSDDRWTALDARPMYSWLSPVGYLYEAQLRWELTCRLGVEWRPVHNGIADVAGIDRDVLREFSTRRREIEAHLAERGQHGARAAQVATYATRAPKDTAVDAEGLLPRWWARAHELGFNARALSNVLDRSSVISPPVPDTPEAEELYRWLASPAGLTKRASTFGEREIIKAICNALPHGGRIEAVLDLVDGFVRSAHVLAVTEDRAAATIRLSDGAVVAARTAEQRWTTPEMLETEMAVIASGIDRRATGCGVAHAAAVEAAIATRGSLSGEQSEMVRTICSSGGGIDIVEGVAGSGKTFALAAAREAWEASGHRVIGCALAARAAQQLRDDAGIPASTIDRVLRDLSRCQFAPRTVVIVDEAAMVGTRKLAQLLGHAQTADAKVVLVGDPCQLPEIDAGGAFRGLRSRLGASILAENRRQSHDWERDSLNDLRSGRVDQALDAYEAHGRVHPARTDAEAKDELVQDWMIAHGRGQVVVMVAARLADVDDLNGRARRLLQDQGQLGLDELCVGRHSFSEGDQVLALRNDYRLGLLNGTRGVIERIDHTHQHLILITEDRHRREVPFEYLAAGHLTHGYATTIHKAQGATVDRCLILADDSASREHAYTALSRGRHGNDLYTTAQDPRADDRHTREQRPDPPQGLRSALSRSGAKHLALDHLHPGPALSPDDLRSERDRLVEQLGPEPPDLSMDVRRIIEQQRRTRQSLQDAQGRLLEAEHDLAKLGPVGRRTRRGRRREIEQRIRRFTSEIGQAGAKLSALGDIVAAHAAAIWERRDWQTLHAIELTRIDQLDHEIDLIHRPDQVTHRSLEHGLERDQGIELELGL
jgi:conjugative relaxase-like TrwC/TraI family protein